MTKLASSFSRTRNVAISAPRGDFLTEDQMRASVPSVFADSAHHSRSERYTYIPTIEILRGLAKEGFRPTFAVQASPRAEDKHNFTKHMLRFRREADAHKQTEVAEIVGLNSHGGESAFQLFGGVFRFICANGMVCGDTFEEIRVRHSGKIVADVIEGAYRVVDGFEGVMGRVDEMKQIRLARDEQLVFASAAAELRLATPEGEEHAIDAMAFNAARRVEDRASDLWTSFNRIQENVIRGGLTGQKLDANNRMRRVTTRPVNGIDGNVGLNRALWTLTEKMAELKGRALAA